MIQGTAWTIVEVWHDEDEPTEYRIKVAYEYEYITNTDPFYQQLHTHIEVIEWPEGANETTKAMINKRLPDVLEDLLTNSDESERDSDDYLEAKYQND